MNTVHIRPIQMEDAEAAAALCTQLGYPTDAAGVLARMTQIAGDAHRAVLVACLDDTVVGWIDLSVEYHLQSEPAVLIGRGYCGVSAEPRDWATALQGCGGLGPDAGRYAAAGAIECDPGARACFLSA